MASKRGTNNSIVSTLEDQTRVISEMSEKGGGMGKEKDRSAGVPSEKIKKKTRNGKASQEKAPPRTLDPQGSTSRDVIPAQTHGGPAPSGSRSRPAAVAAVPDPVQDVGAELLSDEPGDAPGDQVEVNDGEEGQDNQLLDPDYQQWLWQQQLQQMNMQQFGMPNFQMPPAWGFQPVFINQQVEQVKVPQAAARQADHEISDDDEEEDINPPPAGALEGASDELLREQLEHVNEADKVSPKVETKVAQLLDRYLKDAVLISEMEKAAKKYPRIDNCLRMKVPRLDAEVFQVVEQPVRTNDQNMQGIQRGIQAAMAAIAPVLDLVFQRKMDDPELDNLGTNVMNGLQLMAFASNAVAMKRREMLKPHLSPLYAKAMTKTQEESVEWLYGGDLSETTKQCETAKRISDKVLKRKQPFYPRGGRGKRFRQPFSPPSASGFPMLRGFNPMPVRFQTPQYVQQQQFPSPQLMQPMQPAYGGFGAVQGFQGFPRRFRGQRPRYQNFAKRGAYQK